MADNNVVEILKGVVGELREIAKSETVIGEPITAGETTILPVVKVSVGFGAGGGQGEDDKRGGFGGGGGGGAKIEPAGFIIVTKDDVKFLPAGKGKWEGVIDAIPGLAKKISNWKSKVKADAGTDGSSDEAKTGDE